MKKAKPRFPWTTFAVLLATFTAFFAMAFRPGFVFLACGGALTAFAGFLPFLIDREKRKAQQEFERVVASDEALVRPSGPVEEDQFLRVPGSAEAESEQLLRASEEQ